MTAVADLIPDTATPTRIGHRRLAPVLTVASLATVAWFAHFSGWRQTGFFADDHSFAVLTMAWTPGDARHLANLLAFSYPEPQGRPLGFLLGLELPYLGYRLAGAFGMYAVGWLILSANAGLLYALLARRLPPPMPLVGGLMFLLFPADTTRPFLCHAHILQPSLTFALVAAHLFLCRSRSLRTAGYAVAALCLVTYETALLPLLAVPLLDLPAASRDRNPPAEPSGTAAGFAARQIRGRAALLRFANRPFLWRLAIHAAVLFALIGFVAVTRARGGEFRAVGATGGKVTVATEVVLGSIRGPLAVAQASVRRPWQQVYAAAHRPAHAALVAAAAVAFTLVLTARRRPTPPAVRRAAAFGVTAVGVSYLLCFTHYPPTCQEGQSTSVHTAAAIGAAAIAAAVAGWLLRRPSLLRRIVVGLYFALLFGHAIDEQAAYAGLWHERQSFWTQVLDLCPDLTDRIVILCDGTMSQPTWYMPVNLWSDAMVPAQAYQLPATFRLPPLLAAFPRTAGQAWRTAVRRGDDGRLVWRTPPCSCPPGQELLPGETILLRLDNAGRLSRVSGTVDVEGQPFGLKPPPPPGARAGFPTLPFYSLLTGK